MYKQGEFITKKFKVNSSYGVSVASLDIVKILIKTEVKRTGNREVQLSISELAEKCSLSVTTVKKSRLVLASVGTVQTP